MPENTFEATFQPPASTKKVQYGPLNMWTVPSLSKQEVGKLLQKNFPSLATFGNYTIGQSEFIWFGRMWVPTEVGMEG